MVLSPGVRDFLEAPRFAVLATIGKDGTPQQTVMWYELQGEQILMNTKRGRVKDANLRRDARVSFCVEDGYRYVTLTGHCTLADDQARAQDDIARLAIRYHGPERGLAMSCQFRREERETILLAVESVSAHGVDE